MAEKYRYLLSSLPHIRLGDSPSISTEQFVDMLVDICDREDIYALLSAIARIGREGARIARGRRDDAERRGIYGSSEWAQAAVRPFIEYWEACERGMRGEMARHRAGAHDAEVDSGWPVVDSAHAIARIQEIYAMRDPLNAEYALISLQWDMLTDYEHYMEPNNYEMLVIRYTQLYLAERHQNFNDERATAHFSRIYGHLAGELERMIERAH